MDCNLVAEEIDVVTVATMSDTAPVAISYSAPPIELTETSAPRVIFRVADAPIALAHEASIPTEIPHEATIKTPSRDPVATILGVAPLTKQQVFAAPQPVMTELADRVAHGQDVSLPQAPVVPTRPRQRLSLAAVAPVTMVVRHRRSAVRRVARAVINRMRRWWLPATVATTLVATTLTIVLIP